MKEEVRIDKWLWAMRLFKNRTLAVEACKKGRVLIKEIPVKPSKNIQEGDIIQIKRPPITYTFRVLQLIERRLGAKLVPEYMENITPIEQYHILETSRMSGSFREKGLGRPTKKERRDIDTFMDEDWDI